MPFSVELGWEAYKSSDLLLSPVLRSDFGLLLPPRLPSTLRHFVALSMSSSSRLITLGSPHLLPTLPSLMTFLMSIRVLSFPITPVALFYAISAIGILIQPSTPLSLSLFYFVFQSANKRNRIIYNECVRDAHTRNHIY